MATSIPSDPKSEKDLKAGSYVYEESSSPPSSSETLDSDYPEGGRDAVLTIVGACFANFVEFGLNSLVGVLQVHYSSNQLQGMGQSQIAWIGNFQVFMTYFAGAFIGRMFDSVGPQVLLGIGAVVMTLGLMMVSLCRNYYELFLAQGIVVGLGGALAYSPSVSAVAHWYQKKRGTMMGVVGAGAASGSVVLPITLNKLIIVVGFPWAIRITGFICLVCMLVATALVKARLPPREYIGLQSVLDFGGLRDVRYVLLVIGSFLYGLGCFNPFVYVQTFSKLQHYPVAVTSYILAITNAASFFGRLVPGILADRFGLLNLLATCCTCSAIIMFCWASVSSPTGLVLWGIFYGFSSGVFVSLPPACVAKFTKEMNKFGGRAGLAHATGSISTLISGPVAGALIDSAHGQFRHMIIFSGVMCVAGVAFFWASRFAGNHALFARY